MIMCKFAKKKPVSSSSKHSTLNFYFINILLFYLTFIFYFNFFFYSDKAIYKMMFS